MNKKTTKQIVLTGILVASLTGGKLALSALPNIEIVTLLIVIYAGVFGLFTGFRVALIFCIIEGFLYGFSYWLVLYLTYWPLLTVGAFFISRRTDRAWVFFFYAVAMTLFFGTLSTFIDMLFLTNGFNSRFFYARYINGIPFFFIHVVCNAVLFATAFAPLRDAVKGLKIRYYERNDDNL